MSEYAIASGDHSYAVKALKLFNDIRHFLSTPGITEPKYCERVQMKGHSIIMILINVASRIRAAINDPVLDRQIEESIAILRKDFMHPEFKALLETVGPNGEFIDTNATRTINPAIVSRPHGLFWKKPRTAIGIRKWLIQHLRFWIGRGSGAGTKNTGYYKFP